MHRRATGFTALRFGIVAAIWVIILPVRGDSTPRALDLCRLIPGLHPGFARHLVLDSDLAFHRYCDDAGQLPIRDAYAKLDTRLWTAPPDSYLTRFRALSPYLERMATALATLYGSGECIQVLEYRRGLGAEGVVLNRLVGEMHRLQRATALPVEEREAGFRGLVAEFERMGYEHGIVAAEGALARLAARRGDVGQRDSRRRSALARARRLGEVVMVCQLLGEMGYDHRAAGNLDSMMACYREGIAIADRHRIPDQAARLRRFLASHYANEGRLAVAADLIREAQSVCRRWGGGPFELREILWAMGHFAELGCWDIVSGLSQRLPVLLRMLEQTNHQHEHLIHSLTALRWDGQLAAAQGRPAQAADFLARLAGPIRRVCDQEQYGALQVARAEALLAAGQPKEALEVAAEGIAHADSNNLTSVGGRLALVRARAALDVGDLELTGWALRQARTRLKVVEPVTDLAGSTCDALEVGIALARGEGREAHRQLQRSLLNLRRTVHRLDVGPDSYLALAQAEELREVGHRLLANDAPGSYRFELDWRSLPGRLGRGGLSGWRGAASREILREHGGVPSIHLVYGFTEERLTRWTLSSGTVRRDVLPVSRRECDRRVDLAMRLLSRDPGSADAPLPDSLRAACADLGRLLLTREIREGPPARLVVSAEGSVARLPFEALDLGTGAGYEPLLNRHDVVYARPVPGLHRRMGDGTSVILLGGDGGRGEPTALASLAAAENEAAQAGTRFPSPRTVRCDEISKQALLGIWSRASIIYVAAHLVREKDAPLLCYFPMTFGARQNRLEDTYLDLRDARTVDLSGCELAVLSSCASGEPYVVGGRAGPSMADALLDAGAQAVIHTRWQVRDDRAAILAPRLSRAWLDGKRDPVKSWCADRRTMLRSPNGWRHPFEWAAWSVTVGLPVRPWKAEAAAVMAAAAGPAPSEPARPGESGEPSGSPP